MLLDGEKYESQEARAKLAAREKQVQEKEEMMVMEGHVCPVTRPRVTTESLYTDLKKNFYDAEKMKNVWCTVDAALYSIDSISDDLRMFLASAPPEENPAMIIKSSKGTTESRKKGRKTASTPRERKARLADASDGTEPDIIRRALQNLSLIGKPSVDGIAASVDFSGVRRGFVVKTPKKGKDPELLTHELVLGTELNRLRNHIPNFALIFGGFKCSPPDLVEKNGKFEKKPKEWCKSKQNGVRYVLYENVFIDDQKLNADFSDFAKSCTTEQWLSVYIATLLALQFASEAVGFTHNDLHSENILVRQTDKPLLVPYGLAKRTYYTYSDLIPTFIDYGRSVIRINDEWFGDYTQAGFGSDPEGTCPFQDAYKLLMFSLGDLQDANPAVFTQVSKIFNFFNAEETATEALATQRPFYYVIPYEVPQIKGKGLYDLIDYIVGLYPHLNLVYGEEIISEVDAVCPSGVAPTNATCRGTKSARETLINYTQPQSLEQLYNVAPFASKTQLQRMLDGMDNADALIKEKQIVLGESSDDLEALFKSDVQYTKTDYDNWVEAIGEWSRGGADMGEIASNYTTLREDATYYLGMLSILSSLYQHAKVLDFAEQHFMAKEGDRWIEDIRALYEEVMAESISNMFAVLGVANDYLWSLGSGYFELLQGEFDTPIDLMQDFLEPYVKRKYLDQCIGC